MAVSGARSPALASRAALGGDLAAGRRCPLPLRQSRGSGPVTVAPGSGWRCGAAGRCAVMITVTFPSISPKS